MSALLNQFKYITEYVGVSHEFGVCIEALGPQTRAVSFSHVCRHRICKKDSVNGQVKSAKQRLYIFAIYFEDKLEMATFDDVCLTMK